MVLVFRKALLISILEGCVLDIKSLFSTKLIFP